MLKNYLKIALRNIQKYKGYTFINIFSLAIGITCCILIFTFLRHELSYDSFHKNKDSIFRILRVTKKPGGEKELSAIHPLPLGPALLDEIPEFSHVVRILRGSAVVSQEEKSFREGITYVDKPFFEVFTFPFLKGTPSTALKNLDSIVLSEKMAAKYFGDEDPLGRSLILTIAGESLDLIVTGVAKKAPDNSSIQFDFVLPYERNPAYKSIITNWGSSSTRTYAQLAGNVSSSVVEEKLPEFVSKYFGEAIKRGQESGSLSKDSEAWQLHLQPIKDVHLNPKVKWGLAPTGNPLNIYVLSGLALLVLVVACINFITLAVGRSVNRAKEVGVRKVLGAMRKQLMMQFMGESLLLSFFALFFGAMLAELFLPSFNSLVNKNLSINYGTDAVTLLSVFVLMCLVGIFAGSYPAVFLSGFHPVEALRAKFKIGGKGLMTKSLVMVQYILSIFLIISTLLMWKQLNFMRSKPLGFDKEQILSIQTYTAWEGNEGDRIFEIYKNELAGQPDIINMAGTVFSFTQGWSRSGWRQDGKDMRAYIYRIDQNYLDTLEIELLVGRNFSEKFMLDANEAVIVNEALVKELGWESAIGRKLVGFKNVRGLEDPVIIGVVKNFHFESLHREIEPVILHVNPSWPIQSILVRINPENVPRTLALLRETWQKITSNKPFEYHFMSDKLDNQYKEEERWSKIVSYSSILAILISCLGLFGLTSLRMTQRTKEIGIRKILGATVSRIVKSLSLEFIGLVAAANLVAWPLAYYAMNRWIQNFAYRIDIDIWIFLLATTLAVLIALATVSFLSIKAALSNPVESLRYE